MEWEIPFNSPTIVGTEEKYLEQVFTNAKYSGGGDFNKKCNQLLKNLHKTEHALLTTSATSALEMAALLADLEYDDEVILPSYAFTSTATAFVRTGAKLIFVDIDPLTMNIDPKRVEEAISAKTKVIVALHYAGVSCDMDQINAIANQHNILVIEDSAQAVFASYKDTPCGSLSAFGCLSFHETKNIQCGEGGALLVNKPEYSELAEILLEKGTNRMKYFRGELSKYEWVGIGSSFVPSELNASFLLPQLLKGKEIITQRLQLWAYYQNHLSDLAKRELVEVPSPPTTCSHNGHIYWLKCQNKDERDSLINFLKKHRIGAAFHYIPLHSAPAGLKYGKFHGSDEYTTKESERLLRLPLFHSLENKQQDKVIDLIFEFFR